MIGVIMVLIIIIGAVLRYIISIDDFGESSDTLTDEEREETYKAWQEEWEQSRAEKRWGRI